MAQDPEFRERPLDARDDAHPRPPERVGGGFLTGLYVFIGLMVIAIILLATGVIDFSAFGGS